MQRGIAILLALIFGMGPLSAVLPGAADANLPACCRRNGAHRCAMAAGAAAQMAGMMAAAGRDGRSAFSAPATCPAYPGPLLALLTPAAHALRAPAHAMPVPASVARAPLPGDQPHGWGPGRTYAGRGPPATTLG